MEKGGNRPTTPSPPPPVPAKKRSGAISLLRAAMFTFRSSSNSKKAPVNANVIVDASAAVKTIVSGMRPLHQLDYQRHPPPPPPPPAMALDSYYDVHLPPPSPCSSDTTSRYASAEDLQALDTSEDNEEESSNGELNVIDMKAEEFIAMFYKQMKLQQSNSHKTVDEEETEQQQQQSQSPKMIEEEVVIEETAEGATRLQQSDSLEKVEKKATVEEIAC